MHSSKVNRFIYVDIKNGEGGALRFSARKTLKVVEEDVEGSNLDRKLGNRTL